MVKDEDGPPDRPSFAFGPAFAAWLGDHGIGVGTDPVGRSPTREHAGLVSRPRAAAH
jgi:hypothetical protein